MTFQVDDLRLRSSATQVNSTAAGSLVGSVASALRGLWLAHVGRRSQRALHLALRSLDERTLRDIGGSRASLHRVVRVSRDRLS